MSCPGCQLRLPLSSKRLKIAIPKWRAFHTTPPHRRGQLGAFTYPQEWQTGTYHFNKANQKTFPVAAQHTDGLLNQWLTQQKKRAVSDSAAYQLMLKSSIAAQRRQTDRVFISKTTAKDFGDRVEVSAFLYDGVEAAIKEAEKRKKARMGVKAEGGEEGGRRRPRRLRALSGPDGSGTGAGAGTAVARPAGARRFGGTNLRSPGAGTRRVVLGAGPGRGRAGRPPVSSALRRPPTVPSRSP